MSSPPHAEGGEPAGSPGRASRVEIAVSAAGSVSIHHRELFGMRDQALLRRVILRLFAIPEVARVAIRPRAAVGQVYFADGPAGLGAALRKLAGALLGETSAPDGLDKSRLHIGRDAVEPVWVFRYGAVLTTWRVVHELAGRIRMVHPGIHRRARCAGGVEHELRVTCGVLDARANPVTGSLLVLFDPYAIDRDAILELAELALSGPDRRYAPGYDHPHLGLRAANATLAVATVGQLAFPPLLALSAGMLVCAHLDTFDAAWRQAKRRQLGPPAVMTAIVVLTLGTGSFLAAALAVWMIEFWDRAYHRRLTLAQQRLLAQLGRRPPRIAARRQGVRCELRFADLLPGDEVLLNRGDVVPGDARVIAGECEVGERIISTNGFGPSTARPGDRLHAGAVIVAGEVTLQLTRCGEQTRAAALIRAVESATTPAPAALTARGGDVAARAATPTLATAALALLIGDPVNALAVLRPDYASGPGMHAPIATLYAAASWLQRGIVVSDRSVVQRLTRIDVIVIDASACTKGDERAAPALAGLVQRLRARGLRVGVVRSGMDAAFGADFELNGSSQEHREHLDQLRSRGARIAFAGDCGRDRDMARGAELAISITGPQPSAEEPAQVWVQADCWMTLDFLWEVVGEQREEARARLAYTLIPNGVCIAGAFLFGFTSVATLMLTNLGTGWGFARHLRELRQLERGALQRSAAHHPNGMGTSPAVHTEQTHGSS